VKELLVSVGAGENSSTADGASFSVRTCRPPGGEFNPATGGGQEDFSLAKAFPGLHNVRGAPWVVLRPVWAATLSERMEVVEEQTGDEVMCNG